MFSGGVGCREGAPEGCWEAEIAESIACSEGWRWREGAPEGYSGAEIAESIACSEGFAPMGSKTEKSIARLGP